MKTRLTNIWKQLPWWRGVWWRRRRCRRWRAQTTEWCRSWSWATSELWACWCWNKKKNFCKSDIKKNLTNYILDYQKTFLNYNNYIKLCCDFVTNLKRIPRMSWRIQAQSSFLKTAQTVVTAMEQASKMNWRSSRLATQMYMLQRGRRRVGHLEKITFYYKTAGLKVTTRK